jgi:hypothetical protein
MPRRNQRSDEYVPLDLTVETPKRKSSPSPNPFAQLSRDPYPGATRDKERVEKAERQRLARMNRGIDWNVCIVPGCGESLTPWRDPLTRNSAHRDSRTELPICHDHAAVIWKQMAQFKSPEFIDAIIKMNAAIAERAEREVVEEKTKFMARQDGDIYFIRIGGLVKVGWTRDLWQRLKSYGASAELLVSYPGTRTDETNLHRQLRPALAKGREWYEDGPIIAAFIDEALARYGMPPTFEGMWTQPKRVVAGKRHR